MGSGRVAVIGDLIDLEYLLPVSLIWLFAVNLVHFHMSLTIGLLTVWLPRELVMREKQGWSVGGAGGGSEHRHSGVLKLEITCIYNVISEVTYASVVRY